MLTHHRATIMALVMVPSNGYQMCITNMTALTSRMKVLSTEMATLKSVILGKSQSIFIQTPLHPTPNSKFWDKNKNNNSEMVEK